MLEDSTFLANRFYWSIAILVRIVQISWQGDSVRKSYNFTPCTFRRCTYSWSQPCRVSNHLPSARFSRRFASRWCSRARKVLISGPCMASIDEARPSRSPRCRVPSTVLHGTAVSPGRRAAQFNAECYSERVTEFRARQYRRIATAWRIIVRD